MLQTEFTFTLPKAMIKDGNLHRQGVMRAWCGRMKSPRSRIRVCSATEGISRDYFAVPGHHQTGDLSDINPGVVENLFLRRTRNSSRDLYRAH
jgi:hypothetical protein